MDTLVYFLRSAGAASELRRQALSFKLEAHVALTDSGFRVTVSGDPKAIRQWDASHAPKAA